MRLAKRSQCPQCNEKWSVRLIAFVGQDIYRCKACGWMPEASLRRWEQALAEAREAAA